VIVSDGVHDDQRLVGWLFGVSEREADEVVVVRAAAELRVLAVARAHVGAGVEGGGPAVGAGHVEWGWVVNIREAWEDWEGPHCFGSRWVVE